MIIARALYRMLLTCFLHFARVLSRAREKVSRSKDFISEIHLIRNRFAFPFGGNDMLSVK